MTTYDTLSETEWAQVDEVWRLLEEGELERARLTFEGLKRRRPAHPDVRIVEAAVLLEESEPEEAFEALRGAERSADPALFFQLRALAQYDRCRFEDARADAERALAVHPAMAEAHDLLSRVHEHLGDAEAAADHAREAERLEPERYPLPLEVSDTEFDRMVEEAAEELPQKVKNELDEVPVIVTPLPPLEVLSAESPPLSPDILGLFAGRHLLQEPSGKSGAQPGVIFVFRRNLLRFCHDLDELREEIRVTVRHEVGHLLGLDEDELDDWGLA